MEKHLNKILQRVGTYLNFENFEHGFEIQKQERAYKTVVHASACERYDNIHPQSK